MRYCHDKKCNLYVGGAVHEVGTATCDTMSKAIIVPFHKYTPYGGEYYEPMLDFFIKSMKKYKDEYDKVYLIDSNWDIDISRLEGLHAEIIKVDPFLRYYDAYKEVLPQIEEDLVLFMDNDMVVYKEGVIKRTFELLDFVWLDGEASERGGTNYNIVSIYDTIGDYKTDKLNGKNKFCPYWFGVRKDLLMKYLDVDWGPNMPHSETFGKLTERMLDDGLTHIEWEEDKSSLHFDGQQDEPKNLGYYHIRAGTVPAVLLAWREHNNEEYQKYIENQPQSEYFRQLAWYSIMGGNSMPIVESLGFSIISWTKYVEEVRKFHGL